jgi:Xaa-Pro dipeptidase
MLGRREVLTSAALVSGVLATELSFAAPLRPSDSVVRKAPPITRQERQARLERVQTEMQRRNIQALLIDAGSTLRYFTGVQWGRSERFTGAVIPASGKALFVTPAFEEDRLGEMLDVAGDIRVWNEHENPFLLVKNWLAERGTNPGNIAVEETARYFILDGLKSVGGGFDFVSGANIVNALRMVKSPAEIALLQQANDILINAYRRTYRQVQKGMSVQDISAIMSKESAALGGGDVGGGVQFGPGGALPHGSKANPPLTEGTVVLMDRVCSADGYVADISRTFIFGEPTLEQRRVWAHARTGQDIALAAAQIGSPAGMVDDAVRAYYAGLGYGTGYALPGLSHRTGHGIGLDVHEPINLVHGEKTKLAAGMCFSNEPGLYLPGQFGVRHEDCFYMTPNGPQYFTQPPQSLDDPIG